MPVPRRVKLCVAALGMAALFAPLADSQNFSEWIQASGFGQVEYRWKQNDIKGCDVEYRDTLDRGKRKYKTRVVFQTDGDEHHLANAVLSFNDGSPNASDRVPACTAVTDITVTRY